MTARLSLQNLLCCGEMVHRNPDAGALLDADPNNRYTVDSSDVTTINLSEAARVDVVAVMRWDLSAPFDVTFHFRSGGVPVGTDLLLDDVDSPLSYVVVDPPRVVDRISFYRMSGSLCTLFAGSWVNISVPPNVGGGGSLVISTDNSVPRSGNAYLSYLPPLRRADLVWSNLTEAEAGEVYAGVDYAYRNRSAVFVLPDGGNARESQTAVLGMVDSFEAPARTDEGISGTSVGVLSIRAEPATDPVIPVEVSRYPTPRFSVSGVFLQEGASTSGIELSLTSIPEGDVTVDLIAAPAAGLVLSRSRFTFTRSNYSQPQTFVVTASHDADSLDAQHVLTASGSGLASDGILNVSVYDDEVTNRSGCNLMASTNGGLSFHGPSVIFERTPDVALPDFILRVVLDSALAVDVRVNLRFTGTADSSIRPAIDHIDVPAGQLQADLPFPLEAPGVAASLRVRLLAGLGYDAGTRTIWVDWST